MQTGLSVGSVGPINNTPYSVVSGDFNNDNLVDFAAANYNNNIMSVFLHKSLGASLKFDGVNDFVSFNNLINNDFTVEFWVKTTQTGGSPNWYNGVGIVDAEINGVANDFGTSIVGNKLAFGIGNPDKTIISTSPINDGNWHHVAATWEQNTGTMSLYIDGNLETTDVGSTNTRSTSSQINIGRIQTGVNYFNGTVDELRIWNVVRTKCEINTFKNCEIPSNAVGLITNFHFNHGVSASINTITTLSDYSNSNNNGTLTNFALSGSASNWIAPGGVVSGYTTTANLTPTVNAITTNSAICIGNSVILSGTGTDVYTWNNGVINLTAFTPSITNSYTVTGTNTVTGCSNTSTVSVTVNALPIISAVTNNSLLCTGFTATLSASGANTYTWSTTENASDIVVSPTVQTTYTVTGTDVNGCENTTTITQDVDVCTGITIINNPYPISVYPNPNIGVFTIELATQAKVEVVNVIGQTLLSQTIDIGKTSLEIKNQADGIYFVKIITNNRTQFVKVIKEQ